MLFLFSSLSLSLFRSPARLLSFPFPFHRTVRVRVRVRAGLSLSLSLLARFLLLAPRFSSLGGWRLVAHDWRTVVREVSAFTVVTRLRACWPFAFVASLLERTSCAINGDLVSWTWSGNTVQYSIRCACVRALRSVSRAGPGQVQVLAFPPRLGATWELGAVLVRTRSLSSAECRVQGAECRGTIHPSMLAAY